MRLVKRGRLHNQSSLILTNALTPLVHHTLPTGFSLCVAHTRTHTHASPAKLSASQVVSHAMAFVSECFNICPRAPWNCCVPESDGSEGPKTGSASLARGLAMLLRYELEFTPDRLGLNSLGDSIRTITPEFVYDMEVSNPLPRCRYLQLHLFPFRTAL